MSFKSTILTASLLALVSANPLPHDVAALLKRQLALPSEYAAVSSPAAVQPTGVLSTGVIPLTTAPAGTEIATAPVATATAPSTGSGSTGQVTTKGSVSGSVAVSTINDADGVGAGTDAYKFYEGDGTTGAGWPDTTAWVSFGDMFEANKAVMKSSCSSIFGVPDNTDEEISAIHDAIESVATASKVDHRFILAIIMQESKGCVRVKTTNYGVRNPGLMQDHDGKASCNDGQMMTPCPSDTIAQMISEGTGGTDGGDGLAQGINQAGGADVSAFYKAARIYNSGSIDASGDLGKGIATHCYASDVANRLTGWVSAQSACTLAPAA